MNTVSSSAVLTDESGERTLPRMLLDRSMRVLSVNDAAQCAGIRCGESLSSFLSEGEALRYRACFARSPDTLYDPLMMPQNCAVFAFEPQDCHGFGIAYVEFTYTLRSCRAEAVLFSGLRDYLSFLSCGNRSGARYRQKLREALRKLRQDYKQMWDGKSSECSVSAEAMASASLLTMQCFQPLHYEDSREERLHRLYRFLTKYLPRVQQNTYFIDCTLTLEDPADGKEIFASFIPENLCFLLTALLGILNDLSGDRRITIALSEYAGDCEIRLTTGCTTLPPFMRRTADILSLAPFVSSKRLMLSMAEYIAGYSGYQLYASTDEKREQMTFSLYMPRAPQEQDFKSPGESLKQTSEALESVGALCFLLNAYQEEQDHDNIH